MALPQLLFYSYSSKDEKLRQELETHLAVLRREGVLNPWGFRKIEPGAEWESEISAALETARIILLLVSADFLNSDYCWGVEVRRALTRHENGDVLVIPIILRDCDWQSAPFAKLQALPPGARPVTRYKRRDQAWTEVVKSIRDVVTQISTEVSAGLRNRETPEVQTEPTPDTGIIDSQSVTRKASLLAIEGDAEVASLYESYFSKRYEVTLAPDAQTAIRLMISGKHFDIVILELQLDGMSGVEWLQWYYRTRSDRAPVVIASGASEVGNIASYYPDTAALSKPFHMEELGELVEVLLSSDWSKEVSEDPKLH